MSSERIERISDDFAAETPLVTFEEELKRRRKEAVESGKLGVALLMWLLGVPGILIVAYLIFGG